MKKYINKTLILYFFPALSVIYLMGCASFTPYTPNFLGTDQVVDRNYELDVKKTTYVGESMIKVKDYYLSKYSAKTMSPNVDVTISLSRTSDIFHSGTEYDIAGQTLVDEKTYDTIKFSPPNDTQFSNLNLYILMSENGEISRFVIFRQPSGRYGRDTLVKYKVNPPDAKFIKKDFTKTDTSQGYENYELIYTGKDKDALHITYREYSPENLARTAFYQSLTYPSSSTVIRFKAFKILVDKATSESITFNVVEDGGNVLTNISSPN